MVLVICDIIIASVIFFYTYWFIRNAQTRFQEDVPENSSECFKKAIFLRKDWLKGSLLFKGWHKLLQWCSIIFPIMILFFLAYSDNDETVRVIIYTCLSLIASIFDIIMNFAEISNCFRKSYIIINCAIIKYENKEIDEKELYKAISKGEKNIEFINKF